MRFTVVATGQFSLRRAFGFRLAASSLTQLSVVNSPIRPAGLSPAWHPASPAHARTPKSELDNHGWTPMNTDEAETAGADAVMIEVHDDPEHARSDGEQALRPEVFADLVRRIRAVAEAVGREL